MRHRNLPALLCLALLGGTGAAAQCPDEAKEQYKQGKQLFLDKQYAAAEAPLRKSVELCPAEPLARTYLGLTLGHQAASADPESRRRLLDQAKEVFDEAIQIQFDNPRINQAYGTLYLLSGNFREAETKFGRAVEILQQRLAAGGDEKETRVNQELLAQSQQGLEYARSQKTEMANNLSEEELLQRFLPSKANEIPKIPFKIEFDFGSAAPKAESNATLDRIANVLKRPVFGNAAFEVGGHTDMCGDRGLNARLSNERAQAIRNYLVGKGVPAERLAAKGYGPDQPLVGEAVNCDSLSSAQKNTHPVLSKNRRTEFTLLKGD